jgi:glycosyltransferase involved in cell wall biosynthesis
MATFDVLLPVKNCVDYLAESLDSILAQSFQDWRIIVLDHGSTDGSVEIANTYADKDTRIIVREHPEAQSLSELHNHGLDLCDCKYVLRQDADDVSLPERMEALAAAFDNDPELVAAGSLGIVTDKVGKKIGLIDMPLGQHGVIARTLFQIPIAHPTAALRLDAIQRLGARYGQDFINVVPVESRLHVPALAEDYFMFGQLALVAKCMNIDRSLIKYRWHSGNISATKHFDQMHMALNISRFLAESLSIMHGMAQFDPAPFCNHGDKLFDIDGKSDFLSEYKVMRNVLLKVLPDSYELKRELAFRRVIATRDRFSMSAQLCEYAANFGMHQMEWRTVRSWILKGFLKQQILKVELSNFSI